MSATIDERVVEMRFDNDDFEKNVRTSMSTLQQFDDQLNKSLKTTSLEVFSKASETTTSKLGLLGSAAETIGRQFSLLDQIPIQLARSFGEDLYGALKKVQGIITAIPNQIKNGGWNRASNIEKAKFQLEGLGVEFEKIDKDIDNAVAGTAYGYDQAALVASSLAASGLKYGSVIENGVITSLSDMGIALRAVSGVAAQTQSDYSEIGHIFTTVAGQGKLMTIQLNQFANKGLNVAAELGKQLGKSESEIRDMVTKGKISFEMFSSAMYEAFGEHAAEANKTLSGSLANMKAALSRIGQDWATPILQETPKVFTALKDLFNSIRVFTKPIGEILWGKYYKAGTIELEKTITSLTERITKLSDSWVKSAEVWAKRFEPIFRGLLNIFSSLLLIIRPIAQAFREVFAMPELDEFTQFGTSFEEFTELLIPTKERLEGIHRVATALFSVIKFTGQIIGGIIRTLSPLVKVGIQLGGLFLDIIEGIGDFVNALFGIEGGANVMTNAFDAAHNAIDRLSNIISAIILRIRNLNKAFVIPNVVKFAGNINSVVNKIKEFVLSSKYIQTWIQGFQKFGALNYIVLRLRGDFGLLLNRIKEFGDAVSTRFPVIGKIINAITSNITKGVQTLITNVKKVVNTIKTGNFNVILDSISDKFKTFINFVKKLFTGGINLTDIFEKLKNKLSGVTKIFEPLKNRLQVILDTFEKFKTSVGKFDLSKVADGFKKFGESVKSAWENLDKGKLMALVFITVMIYLFTRILKLANTISATLNNVSTTLKNVTGVFRGFTIRISPILEFSLAMSLLFASMALLASMDTDKLKSAASAMLPIMIAFGAITALLTLLMKFTKAETTMKGISIALVGMAGSILMLGSALYILDKIDFKTAFKNLALIGSLAGIMLAATGILTKIKPAFARSTIFMLAFAGSLYIMTKAIDRLTKIEDLSVLTDNKEGLLAVMLGLAAIALACSKIGLFSTVGLIGFAIFANVLSPILKNIVKEFKMDTILQSLRNYRDVVIMLGVIAGAMIVASGLMGKGILKLGAGLSMMALSLLELVGVIKIVSMMSKNKLMKGITSVAMISTILAALILVAGIATHGEHSGFIKLAVFIHAIVLALIPLSLMATILGLIDPKALIKGELALAGFIGIMSMLLLCTRATKDVKLGSIISLILLMNVMVVELIALTFIKWEDLSKALITIVAVMGSLGLVLVAARKLGEGSGTTSVAKAIAIIVIMGALLAGVGIFAATMNRYNIDWKIVASSFGGMAVCMIALGHAIAQIEKATKEARDIKGLGKTIMSFFPIILAIAAGMAGITAATALSGGSWEDIIASAAGMTMCIGVLSLCAKSLVLAEKNMNNVQWSSVAKSFLSLLAVFGTISAALIAVSVFTDDTDNLIEIAASISIVLGACGLVFGALGALHVDAGAMASAAGGLAVSILIITGVVAAITAALAGIGYLIEEYMSQETYDKVLNGIDKVIEILRKVVTGLGEAIADFMGGVIIGTMEDIGTAFSNFMTNLQPFIDGIQKLEQGDVDKAMTLAKMMAVFAAAEFLDGLTSILTFGQSGGNFEKMPTMMENLGKGISAFASEVTGIGNDDVTTAANAGLLLAQLMEAMPSEGGLKGLIFGSTEMENFNEDNLRSFAAGIRAFAEETQGLTKEDFEGAAIGVQIVTELLKEMPKQTKHSLVGKIFGDSDLENFIANGDSEESPLIKLAKGIKGFATTASQIPDGAEESVKRAIDLFDVMMSAEFPQQTKYSLMGIIFGNSDLINFDEGTLKSFGNGIKGFVNAVKGLQSTDINKAKLAAGLFDVIGTITFPKQTGDSLWGMLTGNSDMKNFDKQTVGAFGEGIKAFCDAVKDIPGDASAKALTASSVFNAISGVKFDSEGGVFGKIKEFVGGKGNAESWANSMTQFGLGVSNFFTSFTVDQSKAETVSAMLEKFIECINKLSNMAYSSTFDEITYAFKNMGDLGINEFLNTLANKDISTGISTFIQRVATNISNNLSTIKEAGTTITTAIGEGIEAGMTELISTATKVVDAAADAIVSEAAIRRADTYTAGKELLDDNENFNTGMVDATDELKETATNVVCDVVDQISGTVDELKSKAADAGSELINQVGEGMNISFDDLKTDASGKVTEVVSEIADKFGIDTSTAQAICHNYYDLGMSAVESFKAAIGSSNILSMVQSQFGAGFAAWIGEDVDAALQALGMDGSYLDDVLGNLSTDAEDAADGLDDLATSAGKAGGAASKAKDEISEFRDSLKSSLESKTGGMSFFNKLELSATTSAEAILENMKSNVDGVASWTARLQQLMERGLDKGLVKTLADAGLDSYDQISAFLQMTDDQIQQANDLFLQAAAGRAYSANTITDGYFQLGKDNMSGYVNGVEKNAGKVYDETKEIAQEIKSINDEEFDHHSPSGWFRDLGDDNILGMCEGMNDRSHLVYDIIGIICNRVKEIAEEILSKSAGSEVGKNFTQGIAEGLKDQSVMATLETNATEVASIVSKASASTLKEKSPSRIGYQQGKFWDMGLAGGISDYGNLVEASSIDVAYSTIDAFSSMTDEINAAIGDIDPIISPLLDTTRLQAQMGGITSMFNAQRANLDAQMNNDWSNPSVRSKFMEDLSNAVGKGYADRVVDAINNKDNSAQVYLEGDAAGVFKVVNKQNRKFIKRTGYSGL